MSSVTLPVTRVSDSAGKRTFIQKHAVALFFALAFALTWMIQIPLVLDARGELPFSVPFVFQFLQGPMPGIAALIIAGLASGRAGILDLLRRVVRWRVGIQWYALAVLGTGAIYLTSLYASTLFGGPMPLLPELSVMLLVGALVQLGIYLVFNWEDLAWRGFATTRLQATHSALTTALLLGIVEGVFHLPLFFSPTSSQSGSPFLSFMLLSVAGVIIFNWVFNNTRGSVLVVSLMHAAANTWTDIVPIPRGDGYGWTMWAVVFGIIAVAVVVVYGARWLSRKPDIASITVVDPIARGK
jgi:hypothetical protein